VRWYTDRDFLGDAREATGGLENGGLLSFDDLRVAFTHQVSSVEEASLCSIHRFFVGLRDKGGGAFNSHRADLGAGTFSTPCRLRYEANAYSVPPMVPTYTVPFTTAGAASMTSSVVKDQSGWQVLTNPEQFTTPAASNAETLLSSDAV
jgi:hypothetical protein